MQTDKLNSAKEIGPNISKLVVLLKKRGDSNADILRKIGSVLLRSKRKDSPNHSVVERYVLAQLLRTRGVQLGESPEMDKFKKYKRFWNEYANTHVNKYGIPIHLNIFHKPPIKKNTINVTDLKKMHSLSKDDQVKLLYQFLTQKQKSLMARYPTFRTRQVLSQKLKKDPNFYHKVLRQNGKFNPHSQRALTRAKVFLQKFTTLKNNSDAMQMANLIEDLRTAKEVDHRLRKTTREVLSSVKDRARHGLEHRTSSSPSG